MSENNLNVENQVNEGEPNNTDKRLAESNEITDKQQESNLPDEKLNGNIKQFHIIIVQMKRILNKKKIKKQVTKLKNLQKQF